MFTTNHVLEIISRLMARLGHAPSIHEIQKEMGVSSTRTVVRYLEWLAEAGDIVRSSGSRGIKILRRPKADIQTVAIPLVGEAPAGSLMTAEENREGWLRLPKTFFRSGVGKFFLLKVRGDSMNNAKVEGDRIENGDLILVRQQASAETGEIVVALVDGEATIKRLVRAPGYFILQPHSKNPEHQPILVEDDLRIQGIVTRVIKAGASMLVGAA